MIDHLYQHSIDREGVGSTYYGIVRVRMVLSVMMVVNVERKMVNELKAILGSVILVSLILRRQREKHKVVKHHN